MKYELFQPLGRKVSKLVAGTMYLYNGDEADGFRFLDMMTAMGVNVFDSAQVYGDSEITLGKWMEARGKREDTVIITKGCHPSLYRADRVHDYDLQTDIMDSLAKLRTDYIDIYLLHKDNPAYPVGPLMETLHANYEAGRIRAYGASNWTHQRIAEANEYARAHGLREMDVSSPNYSLADYTMPPWGPENISIAGPKNSQARAWYQANQMPIIAFSSLARGFFSGKITRELYEKQKHDTFDPKILFMGQATKDQLVGNTEKIDPICFNSFCFDENFDRLDRCRELAQEKHCTVAQIALAYVVNSGLNVFPITGSASESELQSSIEAMDIVLTPEEARYLDLRENS